jgi:ankyrin repeat protein
VELLLRNGASIDFEERPGWTPLTRAVEAENVEVLQLLLARGAKVDYVYYAVSESNYIERGSMADTVILDYFRE